MNNLIWQAAVLGLSFASLGRGVQLWVDDANGEIGKVDIATGGGVPGRECGTCFDRYCL